MEIGKLVYFKNKFNENICKETIRLPILVEKETPRVKNPPE